MPRAAGIPRRHRSRRPARARRARAAPRCPASAFPPLAPVLHRPTNGRPGVGRMSSAWRS
ncbi:hypothetical protein DN069_19530 [Streptacidiphilus pinicola]|uniref:Uncharacterized protein n=1 Tax=Streptacidiphilus pinicola TaxID=2219663 RepID=A0A2X0IKR6_9ACTN|nr:hypothetical protein DN069_19530 [Streptacidiphilus pinicola]